MIKIAKSKYETQVKHKLKIIEAWKRDGLTDEQIARNLQISIDSFYRYKKEFSEFSEALKKGKELADIEVENALFKNAIGYDYEEIATEIKVVDGKEHKIIKKNKKHMKPDTTAQIFWLKNRSSEKWRDKNIVEHEGEIKTNIQNISDDELNLKIADLEKKLGIKSEK